MWQPCNHAFALLSFMPPKFSQMPRFKCTTFYQNKPNFIVLGGLPPDHLTALADGGGAPTPPKEPFPLQVSGYAPDTKRVLHILPRFRILQ